MEIAVTSARYVVATDGQLPWPAMVAAYAAIPGLPARSPAPGVDVHPRPWRSAFT